MGDIVMPRLSDTMEEGTILRWLKGDGERVRRGEELVEIETDKATMTYESDQEGVLEILAREGDTLAVGEPIARVGTGPGGTADERPAARPAGVRAVGGEPGEGSQGDGLSSERLAGEGRSVAGHVAKGERVKASPLARRMAKEDDVDLAALSGSGPGGRIVKADVLAATAGASTGAAAGAPSGGMAAGTPTGEAGAPTGDSDARAYARARSEIVSVSTAKGATTVVELSRTQQTIARRMAESKATIPDFALQAEVDMEECVRLRTELKRLAHPAGSGGTETSAARGDVVPTYNDMVVKACALALREHPRANGGYRDGRLQLHSRVNVGVAVALDGDGPAGGALLVPTVFDAEEKSLGEIARETRALAERVREGTITPPELGGGTFTVSNLGMYGVRSFTAIVNPPQAAILSVGSLERRAVVAPAGDSSGGGGEGEGAIVARHTMAVTLVCDHRILYGADAARFLARVRELLEQPASLTL